MKKLLENRLLGKTSLIRFQLRENEEKIRKLKGKSTRLLKELKKTEDRLKELGVK